jgi:SNF2 family DNA or RNA helicase
MKRKQIHRLLNQTDRYLNQLSERIPMGDATAPKDGGPNGEGKYQFDLKLPDSVTQPEHLNDELKDYQVKRLQWLGGLYQVHLHGILADEIGLGKTIQTIALVAWLCERYNDAGRHLICAALGTLSNWAEEFRQRFRQFKVIKDIGRPAQQGKSSSVGL